MKGFPKGDEPSLTTCRSSQKIILIEKAERAERQNVHKAKRTKLAFWLFGVNDEYE